MNPQLTPPSSAPVVTLFLKPVFLISARPHAGLQVQVQAQPSKPLRN